MYSLKHYLKMMTDPERFPAHQVAIESIISPGDVVLDLGAGVGVLSFVSLHSGASKVYGIEMSDEIAAFREVVRDNGYSDRVICIQGDSTEIDLPERVDVIVTDLRGCLPIYGKSLKAIMDARERFLKPGGRMLPIRERLYMSPVSCSQGFSRIKGWQRHHYGVDFRRVAELASNQWGREPIAATELLSAGKEVCVIEYLNLKTPDVLMEGKFTIDYPGDCNGLAVWFVAELAQGICISSAPDRPQTVYSQAYFPLLKSYSVSSGDEVEAKIQARFIGEDYTWLWSVRINGEEERHSSFQGNLSNALKLNKCAPEFVPIPAGQAAIDQFILELMDGRISVGELATLVARRFPEQFPSISDAITRVGYLSLKYSK